MDNLKVEYHKRPRHLINLISINVDKEILGLECHFSLQHLTDLRFFDKDGSFCTGEKKFPISINENGTQLPLKKEVFCLVEEYDRLRLVIYVDDNKYRTWEFSWIDNPGKKVLEIPLSEPLPPVKLPPDTPELPPVKPRRDTPEPPPVKPRRDTLEPPPVKPLPKKPLYPLLDTWVMKWILIVAVFVGLLITGVAFQDEIIASFNKSNRTCSDKDKLRTALLNDNLQASFVDECKGFFDNISDEDFQIEVSKLTNALGGPSNQLLLEVGKLYDPNFGENLLRTLRPTTKVDPQEAINFYHEAKVRNVIGASGLLLTACSNVDNIVIKLLVSEECAGN